MLITSVMEESRTGSSNIWSTLNTVDTIDTDHEFTGRNVWPVNGEVYKSRAKSLFIESLVDQMCKLLEKDPHRRRKIYEAICSKLYEMQLVDESYQSEELASLRGHYQQAMINLLRSPDPSVCKALLTNLDWSRYSNEYEEVGFIASGGFGKVYKAKHRLDQVLYAVKKISVKFQTMSVLLMESNEVKTLAKLNHPNIVQYKAAWLEPLLNPTPDLPSIGEAEAVSSDSDGIVFQDSNASESSTDNRSSSHRGDEPENKMAVCPYQKCDLHRGRGTKSGQVSAVLYVSMQLCDETLREWLNKRNGLNEPVNLPLCYDIMMQAIKGLEYIHSCNIVHHDIKPSNIFLSNNLKSVQVGDFGLACCLQGHSRSSCPLEGGRFGTPLYAAPEQQRGQCSVKSDMYSLGLVFVELVSIFSTEMERISVLNECRAGKIPGSVPKKLIPLVTRMLSPSAEERPTSSQVLKAMFKLATKSSESKSLTMTKAQVISLDAETEESRRDSRRRSLATYVDEIIRRKDREIKELRSTLAKREDEIARLKQFINSGYS